MPFAIVTGATQGIGFAIAEHLLEAGFSLAFCARNAAKLNELASTWQAKYPAAQLMHAPFDLAKKEDALRNIAIQKKLKWIFTLSADDSSTTNKQYDYNLQLCRLP